jgi:hypothetical protein
MNADRSFFLASGGESAEGERYPMGTEKEAYGRRGRADGLRAHRP